MKNKKFIITCSVLILITTISLIITAILRNEKETEVTRETLDSKTFVSQVKDSFTDSREEIYFKLDSGKKRILIKNNDDENDDIYKESEFSYKINSNVIYIKQGNITTGYKYKDDCIYDINNTEIKYCIEKDA